MLRLAGADPVYVTDRLPWRLELAERLGGSPIHVGESAPVAAIVAKTGGRGVDRVVEAAFCDETAEQACEMARLGGRVVLVGISADDRLTFKHSTARRKGLTIALARRMKHAYPRAIELVERGRVDVECIVSHHFPMERAADAFQLNADYADGVNKVILDVPS
jgi:L-iditol 2-dehydrogenase